MRHSFIRKTLAVLCLGLTTLFGAQASFAASNQVIASPASYKWDPKSYIVDNPNCYHLSVAGSAYQIPGVKNFFYCGNTAPNSNPKLIKTLGAYFQGIPYAASTQLQGAFNYTVYYFQTVQDKCLTLTVANACQSWFTKYKGSYGVTFPNTSVLTATSELYENYPLGTFPGSAVNPHLSHAALHEMGHAFDWANGNGSLYASDAQQPSTGSPVRFFGALGADYAYLGGCSTTPVLATYQRYVNTYGAPTNTNDVFHCPVAQPGQNNFREMFAEDFLVGITHAYNTDTTYQPDQVGVDNVGIYNESSTPLGTICSAEYVWLLSVSAPSVPTWVEVTNYAGSSRCGIQPSKVLNNTGGQG